LVPLFKEIKDLFDPDGLMNPGIIVPSEPYKWTDNLRYGEEYSYVSTNSRLDQEKWHSEIEKCHGCGTCREYCPVFAATGDEEATARAKANILRGIISGKINQAQIDSDQFFKIMDYCLNCGQCLTDCPTAVDIPGMAVLAKEKLHEKKSYKLNEIMLQNGQLVSKIASSTAPMSNIALNFKGTKLIMDKVAGIDKRRDFPVFKRSQVHKNPLTGGKLDPSKTVILWSGCAAQYNDPLGEHQKSVAFLEKIGYHVIVPKWKCCNIAKITYGNINGIENDLSENKRTLLPFAEDHIPILFTSASCGYAFKDEYLNYFPEDDDIKKIAETSRDIHDFLMRSYLKGEFKSEFSSLPMQIIYHEPCHLKSQQNEYGPRDLLKLIPDLKLIDVEDSCCGIAGTFGMKKENYELSMKIGTPLFDQILEAKPELLVSGCGTCQIQLLKGTGIKTVHPIDLLHRSYIGG
jgi:Fe-S oxidoreductase